MAAGNARDLGAAATAHRRTAQRFVADHDGPPWHLVLMDPPYSLPAGDIADLLIAVEPHLDPSAVVVVERPSRDSFVWPEPLEGIRDKAYGETTLWYGRPVAGH